LVTRRAALAGGLAAPFLLRARRSFAEDSFAACRGQLAQLFPNSLDAARALGQACGVGSNPESLLDRLCETPDGRRRLASAPLDELRRTMERKIHADYVYGHTRRIDGWVLSETETRIFAIIGA